MAHHSSPPADSAIAPGKSTNVRRSRLALAATRTGFKILGELAPGFAARTAENLFRKPRRFAPSEEEERALRQAKPLSIRMGLERLQGWRWGTGPAILLVHGWEGRGSQLHGFIDPIVAAGYSAVTWDAPGHGHSKGRYSSLVEFSDGIWAASRQVGELQGILGYSMGAAATALAIHEGLRANCAAFIAAPASLGEYANEFAQLVGLSAGVTARMTQSMERHYHVRLDDLQMERMDPPADMPLLLIHDQADREVHPDASARIAERWPGSKLHLTVGLGHRRIIKSPEVQQLVTDWLLGKSHPKRLEGSPG